LKHDGERDWCAMLKRTLKISLATKCCYRFDKYRGVMGVVYVEAGAVKVGDEVRWCSSGKAYTIASTSVLQPHELAVNSLSVILLFIYLIKLYNGVR
jgi:translation elongation factor EF-4